MIHPCVEIAGVLVGRLLTSIYLCITVIIVIIVIIRLKNDRSSNKGRKFSSKDELSTASHQYTFITEISSLSLRKRRSTRIE